MCINEQSKKKIYHPPISLSNHTIKRIYNGWRLSSKVIWKTRIYYCFRKKYQKVSLRRYCRLSSCRCSEIINIDTAPEDLQTTLAFLPKIKRHSTVHVQNNNPRRFKLPWWKKNIWYSLSGTASYRLPLPLLIVTALAIRIESKGPIIYKSKRVGSNYDIFDFLKFRSMYVDADKRLKEFEALNQYREETQDQQAHTETSQPQSIQRDSSRGRWFHHDEKQLKQTETTEKCFRHLKTIPELPKSDVSSANIASMNFHNWSTGQYTERRYVHRR